MTEPFLRDVGESAFRPRRAKARGRLVAPRSLLEGSKAVLRLDARTKALLEAAVIQGSKLAWLTFPTCHPVSLDTTELTAFVDAAPSGEEAGLVLEVTVAARAHVGVEVEALAGVTAGLIAAADLVRRHTKSFQIVAIELLPAGEWGPA